MALVSLFHGSRRDAMRHHPCWNALIAVVVCLLTHRTMMGSDSPESFPVIPSYSSASQPAPPSGFALIFFQQPRQQPESRSNPFDPTLRSLELEPSIKKPSQEAAPFTQTVFDPPLGYTGPSGVQPRSGSSEEFITVEDRWRLGSPEWNRSANPQKPVVDSPYELGHWWYPYAQNVIKGDYPIVGQHIFLNVTGSLKSLMEERQLPTATTPFESTAGEFQQDFFGKPNQFFYSQTMSVSFDLFHGDASFKPADWRVKLTPTFNVNFLDAQELAVINPDVRQGTERGRTWFALEEWFAEYKLADLSSQYDFLSLRIGSQPFTSDFRGFIYSDTNQGVRLFGNALSNQVQYNLAYFHQLEKDTNSGLNTFNDRNQNVAIANCYIQDFIFPGYTFQTSVHYNNDAPSFMFDRNNFLVRPDPVGVFQPHRVEVVYLGVAGDGHIDRYNISHAFYCALGHDSLNPLAGQPTNISAYMGAVELSYDRDWVRFRVSGMYASGDGDINNGHATGFDSILDNTNFAGENSFWNRQQIALFGVNLVQRGSLYSDLRSSKIQGQSNFVNPGLRLINCGIDFDVTPELRIVNNVNFLWFDKTNVLEQFVFQSDIKREIGTDLSTSIEYRPLLNNNVIIIGGVSTLLPAQGFRSLYNSLDHRVNPLVAGFLEVALLF